MKVSRWPILVSYLGIFLIIGFSIVPVRSAADEYVLVHTRSAGRYHGMV